MGNGWGCYDLGLQNENFVLKAAELGYGTLIMGLRDGEQLRKVLDIPEGSGSGSDCCGCGSRGAKEA